jgi:hypothetical protein
MFTCIPTILCFFRALIMKGCWMMSFFFVIRWDDHVLCVPDSVYMPYSFYWFKYVKPIMNPWNETDLIMVYNLFNCFNHSLYDSACSPLPFLEQFQQVPLFYFQIWKQNTSTILTLSLFPILSQGYPPMERPVLPSCHSVFKVYIEQYLVKRTTLEVSRYPTSNYITKQ